MSSGQQMKKHFLKCHGIKDTYEKMDLQGGQVVQVTWWCQIQQQAQEGQEGQG